MDLQEEMTMTIGYDKPLYVLPFDHRATFSKNMFGWKGPLSPGQTAEIAAAKQVIYDAFKAAVADGVPKDRAGILVDEQFGAAILHDASKQGFIIACPAEKSGQDEFDFEYGSDFGRHIDEFAPTFCKVLVRYNPEGHRELNRRQAARLKHLSDYLKKAGRLYMFELLVPPEPEQLSRVNNDKKAYDLRLRPALMEQAIRGCKIRGSRQTFGRSKALTCVRTARSSSQPHNAADATKSAVLSWAAARTTRRCASG
jgi:5-dehydro-2-deoxygluconokinase